MAEPICKAKVIRGGNWRDPRCSAQEQLGRVYGSIGGYVDTRIPVKERPSSRWERLERERLARA